MKTLQQAARRACAGIRSGGHRGRTDRAVAVRANTRVEIISGADTPPVVKGMGYWKTYFCAANGYRRVLYTPSTFRIVVGELWQADYRAREAEQIRQSTERVKAREAARRN